MKPARSRPGFTLIELLVVLGIVTLMAGLIGLALREGDPARGLESAQATVANLLAAARSQAAANQNRVRLVVDAEPENDRFLRGVHVAVESAPHSNLWWVTDHAAVLARGVYVVPGSEPISGVTYSPDTWPAGRRSDVMEIPPANITPEPDNPSGRYLGLIAPLSAAGLAESGGGDKVVLTVGRRTPAGVIFEHPDQVRGIALSSYGIPMLINHAPDFDF